MFQCDNCKHTIGPAISPVSIITEKREKYYPAKTENDRDGRGWGIAKEIKVCPECADALTNNN